jgi:predicted GNAT family acetyltransferase
MSFDIRHEADAQRFSTVVDGRTSVLEYRLANGVMRIVHTGVPPEVGGRGIAAELTEFAFNTARANGWKVVTACSYSIAWIERHPEYADLIA